MLCCAVYVEGDSSSCSPNEVIIEAWGVEEEKHNTTIWMRLCRRGGGGGGGVANEEEWANDQNCGGRRRKRRKGVTDYEPNTPQSEVVSLLPSPFSLLAMVVTPTYCSHNNVVLWNMLRSKNVFFILFSSTAKQFWQAPKCEDGKIKRLIFFLFLFLFSFS